MLCLQFKLSQNGNLEYNRRTPRVQTLFKIYTYAPPYGLFTGKVTDTALVLNDFASPTSV